MLRPLLFSLPCTRSPTPEIRSPVSVVDPPSCKPHARQSNLPLTEIHGISWTVGSILFLTSWAVLQGPLTYAMHLLSTPRLPFTAAYFGSIGLTLFFALGVCLFGLDPLQPYLPSYVLNSSLGPFDPVSYVF